MPELRCPRAPAVALQGNSPIAPVWGHPQSVGLSTPLQPEWKPQNLARACTEDK